MISLVDDLYIYHNRVPRQTTKCSGLSWSQMEGYYIDVSYNDYITSPGFDDDAENILTRLLCLDPCRRIQVEEALDHPFFTSLKQQQQ